MMVSRTVALAILFWYVSLCHCVTARAQVSSDSPVTASIESASVTVDSQPPTAPILVRPVDATVTSDNRPEFVWQRSTDPNGNTIIYTFYLNNVATYLGISDLGNSAGVGYTARIENDEIKLLPSSSLPEGVYTWYVVAEDLSGNRRSSTTWKFTIDLTSPYLELVQLESIVAPDLTWGPTFEFSGPRDIHFTLSTEPYSTVLLTLVNADGSTFSSHSATTDGSGLYSPQDRLPEGLFTVLVSSLDRANLTSTLPEFYLNITTPSLTLPSLPPQLQLPTDLTAKLILPPLTLSSLPATVAKLSTRPNLPVITMALLAIVLSLLLFLLWSKRYNLIVIDAHGHPVTDATIYHSRPRSSKQVLYASNSRGKFYIPHLGRYSTLTLRYSGQMLILSLNTNRRQYSITV